MLFFQILLISAVAALAMCWLWRVLLVDRRYKADGSFLTVDGVRLHYHHYPSSTEDPALPTLVFLHGASGNAYDSRMAFLNSLRGRYELVFLDRPGLGFSERLEKKHGSLAGQVKLIEDFLEKMGIDNAVVIGHSLGGAVTAALGLSAEDRVNGLAFLAPVTHRWPTGVTWYYALASLPLIGQLFCHFGIWPAAKLLAPVAMTGVFHPDPVPENYAREIRLERLYHPAVFRANARDIAGLKEAVTRQSKDYPTLQQPTLVITGTEDTVVWPSIHCEGLLRDLSDIELVMLDGAGHMPHHTHTAEIVSALERLIARVKDKRSEKEAAACLEQAR